MKTRVETLISKFGQSVDITMSKEKNSIIKVKAFIQPLRSNIQSELYEDYRDSDKTEQNLYIGLPGTNLSDNPSATLNFGGKNYAIKKVEKVNVLGKDIYERAVIEEVKS